MRKNRLLPFIFIRAALCTSALAAQTVTAAILHVNDTPSRLDQEGAGT